MIALIVPLYNEGHMASSLADYVASLKGFREIVLVDASDDPVSKSVIADLMQDTRLPPHLKIIQSDTKGRAVQMNIGARATTSPILLFLHCDTRLPENAATLIAQVVDEGRIWGRFDVVLDSKKYWYRVIGFMINLRSRLCSIATGDQGIFVCREQFDELNGYPEIALMEDTELAKRLSQMSKPALITEPVTTSARRWQKHGVIKTILLMWKLRFQYWLGASPDQLASMYRDAR